MTDQPKIPLHGYTCVVFGTLTQPNAEIHQLASGQAGIVHLDAFEKFKHRACLRTKCHLRFDLGWEDSINQHSHLLLSVPDQELAKFLDNQDRFDPEVAWPWRQLDWQTYNPANPGDVWNYVVEKHTHLVDLACPKRKSRCKGGNCPFNH